MEEIFEIIISETFMNDLLIATGFSIILFAIMQKVKELPIIKNNIAIWATNLLLALLLGIPYATYYYQLPVFEAVVVSLLSFVGAPAIYTALKKQTIINYTPKAKEDVVQVPSENVIDRG